jgi:protein phosphatase
VVNEDAVAFDAQHGLVVVADGLGGLRGGDAAANEAIRAIRAYFDGSKPSPPKSNTVSHAHAETRKPRAMSPDERLRMAIVYANLQLLELSARDDRYRGSASTVLCLLACEDSVLLAHVGDSRAYRVRDGMLEALTEDHLLVNELLKSGQLRPGDVASFPHKNVITRVLGMGEEVLVDSVVVTPALGELFLLCTDGLTRELSDDEIAGLVREHRGNDSLLCHALVRAANDRTGSDNITVATARVREL